MYRGALPIDSLITVDKTLVVPPSIETEYTNYIVRFTISQINYYYCSDYPIYLVETGDPTAPYQVAMVRSASQKYNSSTGSMGWTGDAIGEKDGQIYYAERTKRTLTQIETGLANKPIYKWQ